VGPGVNSPRARDCGREHSVLVWTEGDSDVAIAVKTCIWAWTRATSGASPNGHMLQGGRAHAATGAGVINKSSPYFIFANLSSRSAPCPSKMRLACEPGAGSGE
jgi:hypothetical protein